MAHQILHSSSGIARHVLTSSYDEPFITLLRSRHGLWPGVEGRFRHARQNRFSEGVKECKQSLVPATYAKDIRRYTIKASRDPLLDSSHFGASIHFVADRGADEGGRIRVASIHPCFLNLALIFSGKPD
jgi:hypothetical protein